MHISPSLRQPGKHTKQRFDFVNLVASLGLFQFNPIQAGGGGGDGTGFCLAVLKRPVIG